MVDLRKNLANFNLNNYDFKILIDKSGSMASKDGRDSNGNPITRWKQAHYMSKAIAEICNRFDDDGIDIILFDSEPTIYNNVTDSKVDEVFRVNSPGGSTGTDKAIKAALPEFFPASKGFFKSLLGSSTPVKRNKPILLIIFTDGEPDSQSAVSNVIIDITKKISSREEVGITFLQLGNDSDARRFLKKLDDDLTSLGAKFDIVDTKNYDETLTMSPEDIIIQALTD